MSERLAAPEDLTADTPPTRPVTGRPAGVAEAALLLAASCLPVLGSVLLAPVLPSIQKAFAGTTGVQALTQIVLTAPALVIGATAMIAGRVVDRVGRKGLLVGALVAYGLLGTAPLWLPTLPLIVASRVLVGVAEAAIITCCTTLLVDYFHGRRRAHVLGLQTVCTAVAATLFFGVGGALGAAGWRTPFWLYAVSLPLAVVAARVVWQPPRTRRPDVLPPVPWALLRTPIVLSLLGGLVFYVIIVELSYALDGLGVTSPATIGLISALSSAATAAGAIGFPRVARFGPAVTVPVSLTLSAVGLVALGLSPNPAAATVAAVVAGLGNGLLLPALVTWAMHGLAFEQRGRANGFFNSAFFLGQFVSPIAVLALQGLLGGLSPALIAAGLFAAALSVGSRLSSAARAASADVAVGSSAGGAAH